MSNPTSQELKQQMIACLKTQKMHRCARTMGKCKRLGITERILHGRQLSFITKLHNRKSAY